MAERWTWTEGAVTSVVELDEAAGELVWSRERTTPVRQKVVEFMSRPKAPYPYRCPGPTLEAVQKGGAAWLGRVRLQDPGRPAS